MRAALLLTSPSDLSSAPPGDEATLVRGLLASGGARVVAVPPRQRLDHALGDALGLEPSGDAVLVTLIAGHAIVPDVEWTALGLEPLFELSERRADARVEQAIAAASVRYDRGALGDARDAYRAAGERLQHEQSPRHAEVLVCLGELERTGGRRAEAAALFDRALSLFPRHRGALAGRAALALEAGEHAIAAAMLHRLLEGAQTAEERIETLGTIARYSLEAARDSIERALALRPGDRELLERLGAVHRAGGRWDDAVTVAVALAESITDRAERARALVRAAELCASTARNGPRAVALYEAAIEDDPTAEGAFAAVEAVLVETGDHRALAAAYERQLERLADRGGDGERLPLLRRLAALCREHLGDAPRAIRALDAVVVAAPEDVPTRLELARLLEGNGQLALATRCLELAAAVEPARVETYRRLHELFSRERDHDRDYAACSALVALGEADLDEQLVYTQFAPEATLRPTRAFDDDTWGTLAPEGHDAGIERVLAAVEPAAIELAVEARRRAGTLVVPAARTRHEPATSTVGAVKSVGWAARLLGVREPAIHAVPEETRGAIFGVPSAEPAVVLGKLALTGRSVVELSFLAAHHLAYLRPGLRALSFYPELTELQALLRASVALGHPSPPPAVRAPAVDALRDALASRLDAPRQHALAGAVRALLARGGDLDLGAFVRGVETTACRAALLAAGDVTVAASLLAIAGRPVPRLSAAERARDLLAFAVSQKHAALRHLLGIAVGA